MRSSDTAWPQCWRVSLGGVSLVEKVPAVLPAAEAVRVVQHRLGIDVVVERPVGVAGVGLARCEQPLHQRLEDRAASCSARDSGNLYRGTFDMRSVIFCSCRVCCCQRVCREISRLLPRFTVGSGLGCREIWNDLPAFHLSGPGTAVIPDMLTPRGSGTPWGGAVLDPSEAPSGAVTTGNRRAYAYLCGDPATLEKRECFVEGSVQVMKAVRDHRVDILPRCRHPRR